jgi:hypothetical protein
MTLKYRYVPAMGGGADVERLGGEVPRKVASLGGTTNFNPCRCQLSRYQNKDHMSDDREAVTHPKQRLPLSIPRYKATSLNVGNS